MEHPTPKMTFLLEKLIRQFADLSDNLDRLSHHLQPKKSDDCLILIPAVYNIVDRDKEKAKRTKEWKIVLQEILSDAIEHESL